MIFEKLYDRLERPRWKMHDIPLAEIDRSKVDEEIIHDVHHIALTELAALSATKMFIRDFDHYDDFLRFQAVWSFEEAKHSLVLEKWLNQLGIEIAPQEMAKIKLDFPAAPWIETLTMHFVGEQRLGSWYAAFSGIGPGAKTSEQVVPEPVLRHIFSLMAEDEWRHASCYFAFLKEAVRAKPELLENVGRMILWMLRGRYRHPTNITQPSVMGQLEDPHYFVKMVDRFVTPLGEKAFEKKVLNAYSILAGQGFASLKELAHYLRQHFGQAALTQVS